MTNEERDLIARFIQRVGGAPAGGFGGSVPTAGAQPLPPVDPDADALLADLFTRFPEARYRITQMAFVQEHALAEAQNQISQLRWQIQNMQQAPATSPSSPWGQPPIQSQQQQPPQRGFFDNLFGGRAAPPQQPQYAPQPQPQYAPPPPQYAPGYQPGMFQQPGSGFLGSALRTAAGVAGGVVAGNALMNLFSGGHQGYGGGFGGAFGGGGFGGPQMVENVTINEAPQASPWGTPAAAPGSDPYDAGGAPKDSGWAQPVSDDTDWQDTSGGGWTDTGGSDDNT
jgi:hypothetical protein